jgi:hypothetical protein
VNDSENRGASVLSFLLCHLSLKVEQIWRQCQYAIHLWDYAQESHINSAGYANASSINIESTLLSMCRSKGKPMMFITQLNPRVGEMSSCVTNFRLSSARWNSLTAIYSQPSCFTTNSPTTPAQHPITQQLASARNTYRPLRQHNAQSQQPLNDFLTQPNSQL